jgi:hypothetical protein
MLYGAGERETKYEGENRESFYLGFSYSPSGNLE